MSTNSSKEVNLHKENQPFHWKPVAAVFIIIIASSFVLYGYQIFQRHEAHITEERLQQQKAWQNAVQRAEIAQRNADEAIKRTLEIQAQILKQEIELGNMRETLTQEKTQFAKEKRQAAKAAQARAVDHTMKVWGDTRGIPRDLRY